MQPVLLTIVCALAAAAYLAGVRAMTPADASAAPQQAAALASMVPEDDVPAAGRYVGTKHETGALTIATVTMQPRLDPAWNRGHMEQVIEETLREHPRVRLFHFGETILGWFHNPDGTAAYMASIAETVPGPTTELLGGLAREHGVYVSFGLCERAGDRLHNAQVLLSPSGEIIAVHRKSWVCNPWFAPGEQKLATARVDGAKVALLVCADARSRPLVRALRREKVDVVLAALADRGTDLAVTRFIGTLFDAWAFTANRCGEEGPMKWGGLTTITDPWGRLVQASVGTECVLIQDVSLTPIPPAARAARRALVFVKGVGCVVALVARSVWSSITR